MHIFLINSLQWHFRIQLLQAPPLPGAAHLPSSIRSFLQVQEISLLTQADGHLALNVKPVLSRDSLSVEGDESGREPGC